MGSTAYSRLDYAIRITSAEETAQISTRAPDGSVGHSAIPRDVVDRAARGDDADLRAALFVPLIIGTPVWDLPMLSRVTIEVGERAWAVIPFESFVPAGGLFVRTSPVYSNVAQVPLAFPIRVLETGEPAVVSGAIDFTFHDTYREQALIDGQTTLAGAEAFLKAKSWATAEILHVHDLAGDAASLSTVTGGEPGSVGWFLRFGDRFRTRLIVIQAAPADIPCLRVVAQSIIDRGGPAVWLLGDAPADAQALYGGIAHDRPLDWIRASVPGELFACAGALETLRYSAIGDTLAQPAEVEDVVRIVDADFPAPFQFVVKDLRSRLSTKAATRNAVARAIAGTAQTLGIPIEGSTIQSNKLWGTRAERFGDAISERLARGGLSVVDLDTHLTGIRDSGIAVTIDDLTDHVQKSSKPLAQLNRAAARNALSAKLRRIGGAMPAYRFEDHESDGMLPLAGKVAVARAVANALRTTTGSRARPSPPPGPRHVNTGFYAATGEGRLEQMPQASARLKRSEIVHFGVRIGPKDAATVALGSTALFEDKIQWDEDGAGIEIGVTAIDFDLVGDPVRQVWLPRTAPTELVTFAVRPHADTTVYGMARLRVAIYHRNNVLQSFLVAARLEGASGEMASSFARALNTTPEAVGSLGAGDLGYLARLEYATAPVGAAAAPPRALTIIANDSAGDKVVTIKGDDLFTVRIDPSLPDKVMRVRAALDRASRDGNGRYRYLFGQKPNEGDPALLLDALWDIAERGFDIFNLLVRGDEERKRVAELIAKGGGIHAAHIDASSVIPWALVYDRKVFPTQLQYEDQGDPHAPVHKVEKGLCPASKPSVDGTMPDVECGGTGCLLHAGDNEQRKRNGQAIYLEETVICRRRFWGFATQIEVPAQQLTDLAATGGPSMQTDVASDQPVTVIAGFNPNLSFAKEHRETLEQKVFVPPNNTVTTARARIVGPVLGGRDPLRQFLDQRQPDIVYFYCHALASLPGDNNAIGPSLDFGLGYKGNKADVLEAMQFAGGAWTHKPLVFINGCGSAGFSPYAPSEFIAQFIQGRRASAVIGTEVTVWEALATEMATSFLRHFLDRANAGDALLRARRELLARNNPLGLVYTLYGSSDLTLKGQ